MSTPSDNAGDSALAGGAAGRSAAASVADKEPDSPPPPVVSIVDDGNRQSIGDQPVPVRAARGSEAAAAIGSASGSVAPLVDDSAVTAAGSGGAADSDKPARLDRVPSEDALIRGIENAATPRTTHASGPTPTVRPSAVIKSGAKSKKSYADGPVRDKKPALTEDELRFMEEFTTGAMCDRMNPDMRRRFFRYFTRAWLYIGLILWGVIWAYLYGWQIALYQRYNDQSVVANFCAKPLANWNGVSGVAGYFWIGLTVAYLTQQVKFPNPMVLVSIGMVLFNIAWTLLGTVWVFHHTERTACVPQMYDFSYGFLVWCWIAFCIFVLALVGGYVYVILDQRKILLGAATAEREKRARSAAASQVSIDNGDSKRDPASSQVDVKTPANSRVSAGNNGGPAVDADGGGAADREDAGLLSGVPADGSGNGLPSWYVDNFDGPPLWNDLKDQNWVGFVLSLIGFGGAVVTAVVIYAWQIHLYVDDSHRAKNDQCSKPLPLFNFVGGVMGFIGGLLFIGRHALKHLAYQKATALPPEKDMKLTVAHLILTIVLALMGLFVVGWYVAGSVWTFGQDLAACNASLYWFTFVIVIVGWSIIGASGITMLFFSRSITLAEATRPRDANDRILPL